MGSGVYPVHMVIGMGGQDWQPIDQPRAERPLAPIFPQPIWSLFRSFEFGYIRLHATKSLMRVEYVGNHDGQVHDVVEFFSPVGKNQSVDGAGRFGDQVATSGRSGIGSEGLIQVLYSVFPLAIAFVLGAALTGVTVKWFSRKQVLARMPGPWTNSPRKGST